MSSKQLTVLIPVYNEQDAIGKVIDEVKQYTVAEYTNIVVLDNNSTDDTANIAAETGAMVLRVMAQGKGYAIRHAIKTFESENYVILDGDYTYPAKYVASVLFELIDRADVVIGYRSKKGPRSMSKIHALGNIGLSIIASLIYKQPIYDVCSGMWGFRKGVVDKFKLTSSGFTLEADFLVNTIRNRCILVQIPIEYRARLNGSQPKLQTSDGLRIGWFLVKERFKK